MDRVSAGQGRGGVRQQARGVFPRGLRAVDVSGPCVDAWRGEASMFAERLEEGLRRRIASNPASLENMVGIIILHKLGHD